MRIIRTLMVRNEIDIINHNLSWYHRLGIQSVVIDNGSSDGTYECCEKNLGGSVLALERVETDEFDAVDLGKRCFELASEHQPEWVLYADSDEYIQTIPRKKGIDRLVQEAEAGKSNVIQCHNIEFWMTPEDDLTVEDPLERIRHYSYMDSARFRLYRFHPKADAHTAVGHKVFFPEDIERKVHEEQAVIRHYKFRNLEQGYRKIARVRPSEKHPKMNFHYLKFRPESRFFVIDPSNLTFYEEDDNWNMEQKFKGWRMSKEELQNFLEMGEKEFSQWYGGTKINY